MNLILRSEGAGDAPAIARVNTEAFGQTNEARLIERMRETPEFDPDLSIVAEEDGAIVGHVLFSRIAIVSSDGDRIPAIALAPVAVLPDRQKQGIGTSLIEEGIRRCHRKGEKIIVVLGPAGYYPRFRFVPAQDHGITAPFDAPEATFMVLALEPHALIGVAGTVEYPAPFLAATGQS
ncbi:GCN5 family acetyltransferase [Methanomicrobiaceae archaeon CYW5]|uniref:GNAT family N-acetyltransferase n=1 Tax=Methanovulcanius yangii TaxID=1789227 RepID=UPI0029C9E6D5|nr:N-acetyltransferase [Methanovulcanius yangii]MBT8508768.1 GCN5 family acetyltransferase [Methanovulcanius yangii]